MKDYEVIGIIKRKMGDCTDKRKLISHYLRAIARILRKVSRYSTKGGRVKYVLEDELDDSEFCLLISFFSNLEEFARTAKNHVTDLSNLERQIKSLCKDLPDEALLQLGKTNWKPADYQPNDKITYHEKE